MSGFNSFARQSCCWIFTIADFSLELRNAQAGFVKREQGGLRK